MRFGDCYFISRKKKEKGLVLRYSGQHILSRLNHSMVSLSGGCQDSNVYFYFFWELNRQYLRGKIIHQIVNLLI